MAGTTTLTGGKAGPIPPDRGARGTVQAKRHPSEMSQRAQPSFPRAWESHCVFIELGSPRYPPSGDEGRNERGQGDSYPFGLPGSMHWISMSRPGNEEHCPSGSRPAGRVSDVAASTRGSPKRIQRDIDLNGYGLAVVVVGNVERVEALATVERVAQEVDRSDVVRALGRGQAGSVPRRSR